MNCRHFDDIFVTSSTVSCQNDHLSCSRRWQFRQIIFPFQWTEYNTVLAGTLNSVFHLVSEIYCGIDDDIKRVPPWRAVVHALFGCCSTRSALEGMRFRLVGPLWTRVALGIFKEGSCWTGNCNTHCTQWGLWYMVSPHEPIYFSWFSGIEYKNLIPAFSTCFLIFLILTHRYFRKKSI